MAKTPRPALALLELLVLLCSGCAARQPNHELTIAAAADLQFAIPEITTAFSSQFPGVVIRTTYGSSGSFFAQIQERAPFDLFLSADVSYPRELVRRGLAIEGTEFTYAIGRIVIWAPAASPIDVEKLGMNALRDASAQHIAIANPQHAPYGKAAEAAMQSLGVYDDARGKLVYGENISQTLQFTQSGAADIGIVALSLALAPSVQGRGRYWEIPTTAYPRMEQGGVILKSAKDVNAARSFRSFLLGAQGRAILKRYGFYLPDEH